jgi:hypothetical protein
MVAQQTPNENWADHNFCCNEPARVLPVIKTLLYLRLQYKVPKVKTFIIFLYISLVCLILSGCSTTSGPQIVKTEGDSLTVLHQGKTIKIRPDGSSPAQGKGIKKHGIFIHASDEAIASAMEVHKGREQSVTVPTEDWTRTESGSRGPAARE